MPNILSFFPRKIKPKGIKKNTISHEKIKQFLFDDDYENIQKIIPITHSFLTTPTLLYPGCGCDILTPLLFIEKLLPKLREINLLFVDQKDNLDLIKTILDDIDIAFSEKRSLKKEIFGEINIKKIKTEPKISLFHLLLRTLHIRKKNMQSSQNNNTISFYWNDRLVSLQFCQDDIFTTHLPEFNIYFERAFRIMKDADQTYEQRIYNKLSPNGLLISDSGFQNYSINKITIPPELSVYQEMIVGIKSSI